MIDDDTMITKFLAGFLSREGFEVNIINESNFDVGQKINEYEPDLILLDVMLPQTDGFELCREIRQTSKVPIIFLSARKETTDRVFGLTLGADDYLTKPFDSSELILRVRAVLRRTKNVKYQKSITTENQLIRTENLCINNTARTVEIKGRDVKLTLKEFNLLWLLISHPHQVFTRDQMLYQIWDTNYTEDTGIITTLVKRLREKIEPDPANPVYVETVRGVGYRFGNKHLL